MERDRDELDQRIAAIAALDQPVRRDLYRLLDAADGWISRDEASAALGVPRSVAAFHLDKLADAGVVDVRYERTGGRTGPGAGRPSKLYRRRHEELAASVPERHYDLAGSLLATAIDDATRTTTPVRDAVRSTARAMGRRLGRDAGAVQRSRRERRDALVSTLTQHGYEPAVGPGGEIVLDNCPFHRLAEAHRELVCGMNLDLLEGLLEGLDPEHEWTARLAPAPGSCCVRISAA